MDHAAPRRLEFAACLELLKPITWFAPMWAFSCGVVSSGLGGNGRWTLIVAGLLLTGPLVCGTSQAINDWYDRHVDAINEPNRPIPSGRIPGKWGFYIAIGWTLLSLLVATLLGTWGFLATVLGLALAWAYSAPPLRLKQNGWWGNTACAACYEGLPWITGAAVMSAMAPDAAVVLMAALYSIGAHGIMTLNDFKSVEGDSRMGIGSLPVKLGVNRAAQVACGVMAAPQVVVVGLLLAWGRPWYAGAIAVLLAVQLVLMQRLLADPRGKAPWYNGTGTTLYVMGMLITAFALRPVVLP
ncbi:chlorophyll synthase ChlG [Paeniroseomonas aquatica]|uniref:Chlorophyll synthase ChlG n=1 Tax=Paeniroseomonas aquatica TaxID=373043 RepID=A0ABT8ACY3_9PROT|nr:chlorophyll synthase ChlG [Paeniroseomonas aquatica]MDN3567558.1 chlorophyll synthase ChlG [Paeniroseomonas aquatica]